jgi:hypothetical protein
VSSIAYWTDEDGADGVFIADPNQTRDSNWLTVIEILSGAVIVVQAVIAHAQIET